LVVVVNLCARAFQKAVVVKQFQSPQKMLPTAAQERHDLRRTEKTVPVNEPDDLTVPLRELHGSNRGSAFEAGKTGCHRATLTETEETKKT
jgi:hypothetical protein